MSLALNPTDKLYYGAYCSFHYLLIRFMSLRWLSFGLLSRVILLGIMAPIGSLGILADQSYLKGLKENNVEYHHLAKTLFPFDRAILTGKADFFIKFQIINVSAYEAVIEALNYDPYSANLTFMHAQYAFIFNNKNEASLSYKRLKQIIPNSKSLKNIEQLPIMKGLN